MANHRWSAQDFRAYINASEGVLLPRLAYVLGELQFAIQAEASSYNASAAASINTYHSATTSTIKDREWAAKQAAQVYSEEAVDLRADIRCWEIERDFILLLLKAQGSNVESN